MPKKKGPIKSKLTVYLSKENYLRLKKREFAFIEETGKDKITTSEFIESEIFKPFLARQAKAAGVLK